MFKSKLIRVVFWIVVTAALISYVSGLFIDVTRDAGKYATVSKEIFQNGNFINLTVHGEPYDQKPPLLFWLGALGFAVGDISNFWFKLPVLLLVFFGIYSGYRLGQSLYNRRVGLITAFMLTFSFVYTMYSMDIHTDTPLQAFIVFALWQLSEFIQTKRNRNWILGFTGIGLAMMSKGPIGAVIPAFAVVGHLLLKKDFKSFLDYRWYFGVVLAFVVVSPALIGLVNQFGLDGLVFFFWENNVGRFTGTYVKPNSDPLFYFHTVAYLLLPWTLLFMMAVFNEFKSLIMNRFRAREYFTFTGVWIFFIILSASKSQLPNYIFGIIPLMILLTAKWTDIALSWSGSRIKKLVYSQISITVLLWVAILLLVYFLFPVPGFLLQLVVFTGIFISIFLFIKEKQPVSRILLIPALAFAVLMLLLNTHIFPYMFSFQAPPKAARYYTQAAQPNDTLYNFHYGQYELFFYSEPQAIQLGFSLEKVKEATENNGTWIFTDEDGYNLIVENNLAAGSDTIITYRHLYLDRGGRFINPATREEVLKPMYLIKY